MFPPLLRVTALAALLLAGAEFAPRLLGVIDIPIYRPSAEIGFLPAPNQSGVFLHRNRWAYNDRSMAVAAPFTGGGVLLVGNSIVDGGDWLDRDQRLSARIQARIGRPVWPIAAGGWKLPNELSWLRRHPEVVARVDQVVFVIDAADFDGRAIWAGSPNHPDHRPLCAAWFMFDRLALNRLFPRDEVGPADEDWRQAFMAFRRSTGKPVLVVLYSRAGEGPWSLGGFEGALQAAADRRWARMTWRDEVHPDARGTALLAQIIGDRLAATTDPTP